MMVIDNEYNLGEIVYLKTDNNQYPRIVFAIKVCGGSILYELACGVSTSIHYSFEIAKEVNVLISTTN